MSYWPLSKFECYLILIQFIICSNVVKADAFNSTLNLFNGSVETRAELWLKQYENDVQTALYDHALAHWNYCTNVTKLNEELSANADFNYATFICKTREQATRYLLENVTDPVTKRLIEDIVKGGNHRCVNNFQTIRTEVTISNCTLHELNFRKYQDIGQWWDDWYETKHFETDLWALFSKVLLLYEQLHTYVRRQLFKNYSENNYNTSAIPADLLGGQYVTDWTSIYNSTRPFKFDISKAVTEELLRLNYTTSTLFQLSDEYFASLGFEKMNVEFWRSSMFKKPTDREVKCRPSAWDFGNGRDFRVKMCARVTYEDLVLAHREMANVHYFKQYADQPPLFRNVPAQGFREAVSETIALSTSSPDHLKAIGILNEYESSQQSTINFLFKQALSKVSFLPFGFFLDEHRWTVFDESLTAENRSQFWSDMKRNYQGILTENSKSTKPRVNRQLKREISNNIPYVRHFLAKILQFQFLKSLCQASNLSLPLHQCILYNSSESGYLLRKFMKLGSSVSWKEAMISMTGSSTFSAEPLLEYFQPLMSWLKEENARAGDCYGWGFNKWPSSVSKTLQTPRCKSELNGAVENATVVSSLETPEQWLVSYNTQAEKLHNILAVAQWNYWTNITDDNQQQFVKQMVRTTDFNKEKRQFILSNFNTSNLLNTTNARQLQKIVEVEQVLPVIDSVRYNALVTQMLRIFTSAYVCEYDHPVCDNDWSKQMQFHQAIRLTMATSKSYDLLAYVWTAWRNNTGRKVSNLYKQSVVLANKGAVGANFTDLGQAWRTVYEDDQLPIKLENLWKDILPLYEQLHTYVRRKLLAIYPNRFNSSAIPAHILGNMWAQDWSKLFETIMPYPDEPTLDVTNEMQAQNYTTLEMFQSAEQFFTSMGLYKMTDSFWNISMLKKPKFTPRVDCLPEAEDFFNGVDYGIKMCPDVLMDDLIRIHREMGRVQYFMSYAHQPFKFRKAANPGFDEAIGETIALSMSNPRHLHRIGLLPEYEANEKQEINFLFKTALEKIAFLPFSYLLDSYRWKLFNGSIPLNKMNDVWWQMRLKYQGVVPPVARTNDDFDAGSKYHVIGHIPYIQTFISHVLQFQFFSALCNASKHAGPLHECDFYNSKEAGTLLHDMMQLGSSVPWPQALNRLTGNEKISSTSIVDYFSKLYVWLKAENDQSNDCYGWGAEWPRSYSEHLSTPRCKDVWSNSAQLSVSEASKSKFDPMIAATLSLVAVCTVVLSVILFLVIRWKFCAKRP